MPADSLAVEQTCFMTISQQNKLMIELWPNACRAQKWKASNKPLRLAKLGEILGRSIASAKEINETTEFDAVKRELLHLADNLTGTLETISPDRGPGRRWLFLIANVRRELAKFHPDADAYVRGVLWDGFRKKEVADLSAVVTRARTPGKRATSELQRFYFTLNSRVNAMRDAQVEQPF